MRSDRPLHLIWQVLDVTERRRARPRSVHARAEAEAVADTRSASSSRSPSAALEHLELRRAAARARRGHARGLRRRRRPHPAARGAGDRERCCGWGRPAGFDGTRGRRRRAAHRRRSRRSSTGARPVTLADLADGTGLDPALAARAAERVMAAPLIVQGEVAGGDRARPRVGAPLRRGATRRLLTLMADRAGLAIEHARAYERELGTVETLQRSLLPDRLPRSRRLQIAARYMPGGADVGGDWYDAHRARGRPARRGDGRRGGPRARRGVADGPAAPRRARVRARGPLARRRARPSRQPRAQPRRRPDGDARSTWWSTPTCARVRLASAGHVPPLLVGPDGRRELSGRGARPAARRVRDRRPRRARAGARARAPRCVLYTDGLVEERGVLDRRRARGPARGRQAIRATRRSSATGSCRRCSPFTPPTTTSRCWPCARCPALPAPFDLELDSVPTVLASVRRELGTWLRALGAGREDIEAVQIACHEACANAVEHARGSKRSTFSVESRRGERGAGGDRPRRRLMGGAPRRRADRTADAGSRS